MPWSPSTDFENEVVSFQPDHDYIFGSLNDSIDEEHYPRPESHLRFIKEKSKKKFKQEQQGISPRSSSKNSKLSIISAVQRIARTKALGEQPTLEDWDDDANVERETIAMMRHLGLEESTEVPLDEKRTIATLPLTEEMLIMHNGTKCLPILYNEKFFKLKPRIPFEYKNDEDEDDYMPREQIETQSAIDQVEEITSTGGINSSISGDQFDSAEQNETDINAHSSATNESYATACSDSCLSLRSWYGRNRCARRYSNSSSSGSFDSSISPKNTTSHKTSQKKKSEEYLTAKELYFKNRRN